MPSCFINTKYKSRTTQKLTRQTLRTACNMGMCIVLFLHVFWLTATTNLGWWFERVYKVGLVWIAGLDCGLNELRYVCLVMNLYRPIVPTQCFALQTKKRNFAVFTNRRRIGHCIKPYISPRFSWWTEYNAMAITKTGLVKRWSLAPFHKSSYL